MDYETKQKCFINNPVVDTSRKGQWKTALPWEVFDRGNTIIFTCFNAVYI